MVKTLREGKRFDTRDEHDLSGVIRVTTRPVHPTQHELYLGYAMGYCREQGRPGGLQALQVFWADEQGRFPFVRDCDERVWRAQPRLDQPIGPAELKEWRSRMGL